MVDLDELQSKGKVLRLPEAPWGSKPPRPIVDEPPPVDAALPEKLARIAKARQIADQVIMQLDAARIATCQRLADASDAAQRALRDVEAELSSLPDAAILPIDEAEAIIVRRLTLERMLPGLQARAAAADARLGTAIAEVRSHLDSLSERDIFRSIRREMGQKREQIQALEDEIADLDRALSGARGMLNAWGADSDAHPIRPSPATPAQPAADPARRRLFS